ncbi:MAG: AraC family transcriptional regulator [Sphaerochaetaceae bacterium]|nr:AraC family transcriptional regulator [Sphaerochaetaceae bacterium]
MKIVDAVFVYQMKNQNELKWHGRTHAHKEDEYEIHYFLGGDGQFINNRTSYTISPGTMFVSLPQIVHTIKASSSNPITYYAILLRLSKNETALTSLFEQQQANSPYHIGTNYRFFFEEIKEKALSSSYNRHQSACHQIASLLYQVQDGRKGLNNDNESRHLEKALRIMQKNVMANLTLSELASELHLTESYFIRLFGERMHQTPMKYYMKLKIEAASALLTCTELSIKEIAATLSFSSEFHFSKQFKAKTGLAPTYYRRNYLQKIGPQHQILLDEQ